MWHALRHIEKATVALCCELQRKLSAVFERNGALGAQDALLTAQEQGGMTDDEMENLIKEEFDLIDELLREYIGLLIWTDMRRDKQSELSEHYNDKKDLGEELNGLEQMTQGELEGLSEEEYTVGGEGEDFFQLHNAALDPHLRVEARFA
ncbi:hypothetical protein ACN47E_003402 [Coniothyrium glycines]